MQFIPIPSIEKVDTEVIPYPHNFPKLITLADVTVIKGAFGRILQQVEEGKEYKMIKRCSELETAYTMRANAQEPTLVLSYTLEGNMVKQHSLLGALRHYKRTCFIYYLPPGEYEITMPAGACTTLHLHITLSLLEVACYNLAEMAPLLERVKDACPEGWALPLVKATPQCKRLIKDLTYSRQTGGHRKLHIDKRIAELLMIYTTQEPLPDSKKPKKRKNNTVPEYQLEKLRHARQRSAKQDELLFGTIAVVARTLNMTQEHVRNGCIEVFGKKFPAVQRSWKMEVACKLLVTTDDKITSIAFDLGFADAPQFCRSFFDEVGVTPQTYRRNKRGS